MGTWIGHIAPGKILRRILDRSIDSYHLGVFFVCFAFWWHINNCIRYLKSFAYVINGSAKEQQRRKFQGSTTYPCTCLPGKTLRQLPLESLLKIIITSIHFSIELITGYCTQPHVHIEDENAHHTAMLFGFFLGAWIEILVHYKLPLPSRLPQVMGFLAFAIEAMMMVFHLHARTMIDAHIHQLLGLTIVCSMISTLGECWNPNHFWFIVARSFFALTQGTWFIQAAYVIWPQTNNPFFVWDPDSHRSITLLTMSYAYHLAGNAFLLIVVYFLVYLILSSRMKINLDPNDDEEMNSDYKLILNLNDEDNSV